MTDIVLLFSGGLDSMALAYMANDANRLGLLLFVDYGHPAAKQELDTAKQWSDRHDVPLLSLALPLKGLDKMHAPIGEKGPRIVPGRNLALLSLAVNVAKSQQKTEVWIGCTAEDRALYPDCRQAFINPIKGPIFKAYGVDIRAPFLHKTRSEITATAKLNGWDLSFAWSCYSPTINGLQCENCNSCKQ